MSKTLIIGGVAGGATAAARLRRLDEKMEIILLERGDYISYANCGLPYYIGDVIKEREALLLQTPEAMKKKFNIDVRTGNEAVSIDKEKNRVTIARKDGSTYEETYDDLILATGSSPLKPPIPGIDGEGIYTLWTIPDTDTIRRVVDEKKPETAAVIGGGFIGLEMAENLHKRGIHVSIIEAQNQVMAPIDFEMAQILHENMINNGVDLRLGDGVKEFRRVGDRTEIALASGDLVKADMVILSIGVRPNSLIAKEAGLELNQRGGVKVDKAMRTSHKNIWAVGDIIEIENFVSKQPGMIPLAGPANKQGRIVANNIVSSGKGASDLEEYEGTMGTSIAQVFDFSVGAVGLNEKALKMEGKEKDKDYYVATITQKSHAGYYPMATPMTIKMIFDKSGTIYGAQAVGQDGVDKRIDVLATVIRLNGTIEDLKKLELAYAPPYSSAKDPVNMLGFVAENILRKLVVFRSPEEVEKMKGREDFLVLDIMEDVERSVWAMEPSVHIPLGELRQRLHELPKNKEICTYCAVGVRSYNAARILMQSGFEKVSVLEAGTGFYKSATLDVKKENQKNIDRAEGGSDRGTEDVSRNTADVRIIDCCGLQCPGPIMKVNETLNMMKSGEVMKVSATDMGFARDVESWCKRTGNTYLGATKRGLENIVTIQKGGEGEATGVCKVEEKVEQNLPQGKTMVVFSGDLDKIIASFIIANGAAAMGRPVTMFFTFWGLNALRKSSPVRTQKNLIEKMFALMMPRGIGKLKLSKMNMGGIGTKMMRAVMKQKNVASLEELMKSAMKNGVKLVACTMSMDVMGIKQEELIDGVELAGVATYLGDAEQSNVNLFI